MSSSAILPGPNGRPQVVFVFDVPERLSTRAIEQSIALCAARLRFLLGQQYKADIKHRVSARHASPGGVT